MIAKTRQIANIRHLTNSLPTVRYVDPEYVYLAITNARCANGESYVKVGDKVKVKVTAIKDGKLSLSMKALQDVAATEITEEKIEFESEGEATTSLADLLKKAGF